MYHPIKERSIYKPYVDAAGNSDKGCDVFYNNFLIFLHKFLVTKLNFQTSLHIFMLTLFKIWLICNRPMKKKFWNLSWICRSVQIMSGIRHVSVQIPDDIKTSRDVRNPPRFGTFSGRFWHFPDIFHMHPDIFDNIFRTIFFYRANSAL